jgi:hypothetical protein
MRDTAEELPPTLLQRKQVCLAGRVADEAVVRGDRSARIEAARLFAEPLRIDQAINRLEARSDITP